MKEPHLNPEKIQNWVEGDGGTGVKSEPSYKSTKKAGGELIARGE